MNSITLFSDNFAGSSRLGLGRYAYNFFLALNSLESDYELIAAHAYKSQNNDSEFGEENFSSKQIGWGRKYTAGLWTLLKFPLIETLLPKSQLVHSLDLDYPIPTNRPFVATVHDIGLLTHPEFFSAGYVWMKQSALTQAAQQAEAIICVSAATALEVQDYLQQDLNNKIHIIPEGVDSVFLSQQEINPLALNNTNTLFDKYIPFFLYPGSVNPRKNLDRILQAFELIVNELPHHLVITGKVGWDSTEVLQKIQKSQFAQRIHFLGFVPDIMLSALYRKATALIYASLYEGFGLPIIEAMASGCPVITSNFAPMSEVAGDAAIMINPLSVEDLTRALLQVATDKDLKQQLISRGILRSQEFSWQKNAELTAKIYQQILGY